MKMKFVKKIFSILVLVFSFITITYAEEIKNYDEDIYWALVPQCIRCGSCVEPFSKCQFYEIKNGREQMTAVPVKALLFCLGEIP